MSDIEAIAEKLRELGMTHRVGGCVSDECVLVAVYESGYTWVAEPKSLPKIIEGLIERLPRGRDWAWSDEELREWMEMMEGALRVHYHLPRRRGLDGTR